MRDNLAARMLLGVLCVLPFATNALPDDDMQNISVESDTWVHHKKSGKTTYSGHVKATQGSRLLTGDTMDVYQNALGEIEKLVVYGKPAKHRSLTQEDGSPFEAEALTIVYDADGQQITLLDDARVTQHGDVFEAPRIEYDTLHDIIRSKPTEQERTTITLKPRNKHEGA